MFVLVRFYTILSTADCFFERPSSWTVFALTQTRYTSRSCDNFTLWAKAWSVGRLVLQRRPFGRLVCLASRDMFDVQSLLSLVHCAVFLQLMEHWLWRYAAYRRKLVNIMIDRSIIRWTYDDVCLWTSSVATRPPPFLKVGWCRRDAPLAV